MQDGLEMNANYTDVLWEYVCVYQFQTANLYSKLKDE